MAESKNTDTLPTPDDTTRAWSAASGRLLADAIRHTQAIRDTGITLADMSDDWRKSAEIIWNVPADQAVTVLLDHGHDRALGELPDPGNRTTEELVRDLRQARNDYALWRAIEQRSRSGIMQALQAREHVLDPGQQFPFASIGELVSKPHPIDWLIKPFLPQQSFCTVYGDSGTYKTFILLGMCVAVASGSPWLGTYAPRVTGSVFYICGEGFSGLAGRLRGTCIGMNVDATDIPLFVSGMPVQVLDGSSVAQMVAAIDDLGKRHGKPVLIVLDTLSRCFGPGDENATPDMTRYVAELDRIRSKYGCSIINVHHTGLGDKTRSRGNSAHRAALDMEYRVDTTPTSDIKRLVCTKSKDIEAPADLYLAAEKIPLGWYDEDGSELTTLFLQATEAQAKANTRARITGARRVALDCLTRLAWSDEGRKYTPVHIDAWRHEAYESGITASSNQAAKQKAFSRAASSLLDDGHIECNGDYYYPRTRPDKTGHCLDMSRTDTDTPL